MFLITGLLLVAIVAGAFVGAGAMLWFIIQTIIRKL